MEENTVQSLRVLAGRRLETVKDAVNSLQNQKREIENNIAALTEEFNAGVAAIQDYDGDGAPEAQKENE